MSTPNLPPRKVALATVMQNSERLWNGLAERTAEIEDELRDICSHNVRPDLIIFPEGAFTSGRPGRAAERALPLDAELRDALARLACGSYVIMPMIVQESDGISNAAVLLDREGAIAGVYRKLHPVAAVGDTDCENGVLPGREYPVFDCDFGRIGIQICYDMSYPDGWAELARHGAELIAVPSASPQTIRPAAYAALHRLYIVTSTPRDNVSVINPAGMIEVQRTEQGALHHTIDLSHAVLHWSATLENGDLLRRRYDKRVDGIYSTREDTGVFWSNDPAMPLGEMMRETGLESMDEQVERCLQLREQVLRKVEQHGQSRKA